MKKERLKNTTLTFAFLSVTSISHSFPAVSSVLPPFLSSLLSLPFLCLLFQPSALSRFCFLHFAFSLFLSVLFGFPPSPIPPLPNFVLFVGPFHPISSPSTLFISLGVLPSAFFPFNSSSGLTQSYYFTLSLI